jgi:pyridoxal phosphate enzyme (YggS family)
MISLNDFLNTLPVTPSLWPTVIAVTKYQPLATIQEAYDQGYRDFGENILQTLQKKMDELSSLPGIRWHFIGNLQTRKLKKLLSLNLSTIQSISKRAHLEECRKMAGQGRLPQLLLQVNVTQSPNQSGFEPNTELLLQVINEFSDLPIVGLMAMGPNPHQMAHKKELIQSTHEVFHEMKVIFQILKRTHSQINQLSIGMSNDYLIAIQYGCTMVRLGTLIFGDKSLNRS